MYMVVVEIDAMNFLDLCYVYVCIWMWVSKFVIPFFLCAEKMLLNISEEL